MRRPLDAKAMAKSLRARLARKSIELSHAECLELVAGQFGCGDWNELAARIARDEHGHAGVRDPLRRDQADRSCASSTSTRRWSSTAISSASRWTGSTASSPACLCTCRSRAAVWCCTCPNTSATAAPVRIDMRGLDAFKRELRAENYRNLRPGISDLMPGLRVMQVIDPFGNRLRFGEHGEAKAKTGDDMRA